jgi:hypothetical protein
MDQIDIAENHIDSVLDNLRMFTLASHISLFMVLAMFEQILVALPLMNLAYSKGTSHRIQTLNIVRLRDSLACLIPRVFNKCSRKPIKQDDINNLRKLAVNSTYQLYAKQSINYCQRYSWIAYYITGYKQGWFGCTINGSEITFTYPAGIDIPQSLMHHRVKPLHETMDMDKDLLSAYNEPSGILDESLISSLRHKTPEQFLDLIPDDLFQNNKKLMLATMPRPSVNEEAKFDRYTVGEYYKFWVSLATLMACYLDLCMTKHRSNPKQAFRSLVVITTLEKIAELISIKTEGLSIRTCKDISQDLVFDPNAKRPDIQVHCFFPINNSQYILLSPQLIMTTNWEVCLLRHWSNKSPAIYGDIIASTKDRLADDLASLFEHATIEKSVRKKIIDSNKHLVGDVDLAIYDKSIRYLVVIQMKWLIEPDSFQEESHVREELHEGAEQILKVQKLALSNKSQLIKHLYPNNEVIPDDVTEIQYFLICRGSVSGDIDTLAMDVPLLDYQLSYEILKGNSNSNLSIRFQEVLDTHNKIKKDIEGEICYSGMKLAGYLWRTPVGKIPPKGMKQPTTKHYSNRSPCLCGSGRLYRDCCQVIDTLPEDGVVNPFEGIPFRNMQ